MSQLTLLDRIFEPFISEERIAQEVVRLGKEITADYPSMYQPMALCMLNGSYVFAADLLRQLPFSIHVDFVRYASYAKARSTGEIQVLKGVSASVKGRDVIVVEDIIDSGLTMQVLKQDLQEKGARCVKLATMFLKPEAFKGDYKVDYLGMEIPNRFVVGYGLDYDGLGRNLRNLYIEQQ